MPHVFFLVQSICDLIKLKPGTSVSEEEFVESNVKLGEDREKLVLQGEPIANAFFDMLDTDGDGVIALEEFKVYSKCCNVGEEHAKAVFDALDTDSNGKISRDEYVDAIIHFFFYCDPVHPCNLMYGPLVD